MNYNQVLSHCFSSSITKNLHQQHHWEFSIRMNVYSLSWITEEESQSFIRHHDPTVCCKSTREPAILLNCFQLPSFKSLNTHARDPWLFSKGCPQYIHKLPISLTLLMWRSTVTNEAECFCFHQQALGPIYSNENSAWLLEQFNRHLYAVKWTSKKNIKK